MLDPTAPLSVPPPTSNTSSDRAVVSSLYTDSYATAVIALAHSLHRANVSARLILIYLPSRISPRTLCLASAAGWTPHPVPYIPPPRGGAGTPAHFRDQYTKLNVWALDALGVRSLVYLDADTLVRARFDELFALPHRFAAVPDVFAGPRGFGVAFNAGVMLLRPRARVLADMRAALAAARYPPAFAEQAFLNVYFAAQALRLPYAYNANLAIKRRAPALWAALRRDMRIVHYTLDKPFPPADIRPHEVDAFFEEKKAVEHGLWAEEIGWWQEGWPEVEAVLRDPQCT